MSTNINLAVTISNIIGAITFLIVGLWLIISPKKLLDSVGKFYKSLNKATAMELPESFFLGSRPILGKILGILMIVMAIVGLYLNIIDLFK